jgi:hypothetical protein
VRIALTLGRLNTTPCPQKSKRKFHTNFAISNPFPGIARYEFLDGFIDNDTISPAMRKVRLQSCGSTHACPGRRDVLDLHGVRIDMAHG